VLADANSLPSYSPLVVPDIWEYLRLCCAAATQFVGDDSAWNVLQTFQQFAKESLGSLFIAMRLHQDIEHLAVLINRTPQIL
jgi:hypothetical protein